MAEYIDRESAIDAIERVDWYHQNVSKDMVQGANSLEHQAWYREQDVYAAIENIPAADVRPVKRGHIIEDENGYFWCSACGCNITLTAYTMPNNKLILNPNYCPNCGASMVDANG